MSEGPTSPDCLSDVDAAALVHGGLPPAQAAAALAHLDACEGCHALVALVAGAEHRSAGAPLRRRDVVGRYVIIDVLGSGAMGVVYEAFDPDLGRRVAMKVLRADAAIGSSALLREAQAMARLSHPNVVTVYDFGAQGDEVFIVMELLEGGSLREWLASSPGWRATAKMFLQAAEGLAAAHRSGLVHRDFKPDNVLITPEGVAKVGDFGLARVRSIAEAPEVHLALPASVGESLYRTGVVIGTPAYMSPEQRAGRPSDARSDQYAFAIALREALTGERPGESSGPPRRVPRALAALLARALAPNPESRFKGMEELARALRRALDRRRRVFFGVAAAAAVALVLTPLLLTSGDTCTGAAEAWGDAWDDRTRAEVDAALARAGGPNAGAAQATVANTLTAYRAGWIGMHEEACRATRRGEQTAELLDLRMRCLSRHRQEVAALVALFRAADAAIVDKASAAVSALPPVAECANADALYAPVPLPQDPAQRAAIGALEGEVARALALERTGKFEAGAELVGRALETARRIGYAPIWAKLLRVRGTAERGRHRFDDAQRTFHEAAQRALAGLDWTTAVDAWDSLIIIDGFFRGKPAEGEKWVGYAAAAHAHAKDPDRLIVHFMNRAQVLGQTDRIDEGLAVLERAFAIARRIGVSENRDRALRFSFAAFLIEQSRYEEALAMYRRIRAENASLYGPHHPFTGTVHANEAESLLMLGRYREAIAAFREITAHPSRTADDHSWTRHRLAEALRRAGEPAAALAEDERSRACIERTQGKGAAGLMAPLTGIGLDLVALGRAAEAIAPLERALRLAAPGMTDFELFGPRYALAQALAAAGRDRARTRSLAEQARAGIRPRAERYGGVYRRDLGEVDALLAKLR